MHTSMKQGSTRDVKRLYEQYPYPYNNAKGSSPDFAFTYAWRIHFLPSELSGCRILEAGCGTGHKLVALAITYPKASFVGIDLSTSSLAVARELADKYSVSNIEFRQANIMELPPGERFDMVQSIGVIHHLEDPQKGLENLSHCLKENGILSIWLYHPIGEFERLNKRELLLTLWGNDRSDLYEGQVLMQDLGLDLEVKHYRSVERDSSHLEGNADAFMHPIVNAYRFSQTFDMLKAAGNNWSSIDFINVKGAIKYLNLEDIKDPMVGYLSIKNGDIFGSEALKGHYMGLSKEEKLKVIELIFHPRGYHVFAGRGESYKKLGERIYGNLIQFG